MKKTKAEPVVYRGRIRVRPLGRGIVLLDDPDGRYLEDLLDPHVTSSGEEYYLELRAVPIEVKSAD